jgi:hemolysin D
MPVSDSREFSPHPQDSGLAVLEMLLRLKGVDSAPYLLRHRAGAGAVGIPEMRRCARALGLAVRTLSAQWELLPSLPLPGIVSLRDGGFLLLGAATEAKAIALAPNASRAVLLTRSEVEAMWDGGVLLVTKPDARSLSSLGRLLARLKPMSLAVRRMITRPRSGAKPEMKRAGASTAGSVIIDFADRARKLGRAIGRQAVDGRSRKSEELEFLPAALEIVESPPSPLGRATALSIAGIFAVTVLWACLGTVDIVATAPGKIVPSGRTKAIQPFETSVVRSIAVKDGQNVKAGDVLIQLDSTMNEAELARFKSDLLSARLETTRLRAVLSGHDDPASAFEPPAGTPATLAEMQRRFLASQVAEQQARIAEVNRQIAQKKAEHATIRASIDKLKAVVTPLQQRVEIREQLYNKELGSKLTYLTELQDLIGLRQEVMVQESRFKETDAAIAALIESRARIVAEHERSLFDELAKAEQKAAAMTQEVVKADQRTSLQTLRAPVNGRVQQLAIHTVGGVVTPAQVLMLVVPAESPLEIEATISNQDIGFVEIGQSAAIKIDTFNFTRYGLLHGTILDVSQDAVVREKPEARTAAQGRRAETGSESQPQELIYVARVSVDRTRMNIEDKSVGLSPGMSVTVEIKTGSRSIISYLLSPLARYKHDSLRER